ncbi:MAG: hypothetical protein ABH852_00720 [Methanobacteriota archaeon]
MEEIQQRMMPARPRRISDVKIGDERVKVVGLVVDKRDVEFTLDDGSGRLTVIFDDPSIAESFEIGSKVRVFGTPLSVAGMNELHADIAQRVDKLDLSLYNQVRQEAEKLERDLGR